MYCIVIPPPIAYVSLYWTDPLIGTLIWSGYVIHCPYLVSFISNPFVYSTSHFCTIMCTSGPNSSSLTMLIRVLSDYYEFGLWCGGIIIFININSLNICKFLDALKLFLISSHFIHTANTCHEIIRFSIWNVNLIIEQQLPTIYMFS